MGRRAYAVVLTDISGTAHVTPGTSIEIAAANFGRSYFLYQNISSTAITWLNFGAAAGADSPGSIFIGPKGVYEKEGVLSGQSINIVSDVSLSKFTAKEA